MAMPVEHRLENTHALLILDRCFNQHKFQNGGLVSFTLHGAVRELEILPPIMSFQAC